MGGFAQLPALVDKIQSAATQPEQWRDVLESAGDALDLAGLALLPSVASSVPLCNSRRLDEAAETYVAEKWFENNPRLERGEKMRAEGRLIGRAGLFVDYTTFPQEEECGSAIQKNFFDRFNLRWFCGAHIRVPNGPPLVVSFERYKSQPRFSRNELKLIDLLCGHIGQAARVTALLGVANAEAIARSFETLSSAVALVRPDGRVLSHNQTFDGHLGADLRIVGGKLWHKDRPVHDAIRTLIAGAIDASRRAARHAEPMVVPMAGRRPIVMSVFPLAGSAPELFGGAAAMVVIHSSGPERKSPPKQLLQRYFGFSAAEADMARLMVEGLSVTEIAAKQNVAIATSRNRLASMFLKASVSRQAELVSLIERLSSFGVV